MLHQFKSTTSLYLLAKNLSSAKSTFSTVYPNKVSAGDSKKLSTLFIFHLKPIGHVDQKVHQFKTRTTLKFTYGRFRSLKRVIFVLRYICSKELL